MTVAHLVVRWFAAVVSFQMIWNNLCLVTSARHRIEKGLNRSALCGETVTLVVFNWWVLSFFVHIFREKTTGPP
jgi:hypothetical protein